MTHPTKRCDTCEFWDRHDQWEGDNTRGNCHRNAPRPTIGAFEYEMLKHTTIIAWKYADDEQKKNSVGGDFQNWEEAHISFSSWPIQLRKIGVVSGKSQE